MIYFDIADLVGNAFISYFEKTGKRILTLRKIEKFGSNIVKDLNSKGICAALSLSRNGTYAFFNEYSDWFIYVESEGLVILKDNVSVDQLITKFLGCLSVETLLAFLNEENIKVLLEE